MVSLLEVEIYLISMSAKYFYVTIFGLKYVGSTNRIEKSTLLVGKMIKKLPIPIVMCFKN